MSESERSEAVRLYGEGWTCARIGEELGRSKEFDEHENGARAVAGESEQFAANARSSRSYWTLCTTSPRSRRATMFK
jgi:hypothetical protein